MVERNPDRLNRTLHELAGGDVDGLSAENKKVFFLAGGGYNDALQRNTKDWVSFSIWGGHRMTEERLPDPYSFAELQQKNIAQDMLPGIRVVLDRVLSEDWLFVIRETAVFDDKSALNNVKKRLGEHRAVIAELAFGDDLVLANARIKYYEALATYRAGQRLQGSQLLIDCAPAIEKDDDYFAHLRQLVIADAKE